MPKKTTFRLAPLNLGSEPLGQRIARFRKEKGYTQNELAQKIAIDGASDREIRNIRVLISDYERGILRPNYEVLILIASVLKVTTDELLGLKPSKNRGSQPSLKVMRRLLKIESLPPSQQRSLLNTIDAVLKAAEK